jgi:hypothetical protein
MDREDIHVLGGKLLAGQLGNMLVVHGRILLSGHPDGNHLGLQHKRPRNNRVHYTRQQLYKLGGKFVR